jgi:hypothetical protein
MHMPDFFPVAGIGRVWSTVLQNGLIEDRLLFQMGNMPFSFFELHERLFFMLHHESEALRNGRIAFETEIDVLFDNFNRHPGLLEAFNAVQPIDRFFVEHPNVVRIALYARHQSFIRVKAYGVLSKSRYRGSFLHRVHMSSSLENK